MLSYNKTVKKIGKVKMNARERNEIVRHVFVYWL